MLIMVKFQQMQIVKALAMQLLLHSLKKENTH